MMMTIPLMIQYILLLSCMIKTKKKSLSDQLIDENDEYMDDIMAGIGGN